MHRVEAGDVTDMYLYGHRLNQIKPLAQDLIQQPVLDEMALHHLIGIVRELDQMSLEFLSKWLGRLGLVKCILFMMEAKPWEIELNAILEQFSPFRLENQARDSILATLKQFVTPKHMQYHDSLRNMKALLSLCFVPLRV